jgi:hypothetical protein
LRVRVRFRYNSRTGEVETFVVEDLADGQPVPGHDDLHEALASDVGRVVDPHPRIAEEAAGAVPVNRTAIRSATDKDENLQAERRRIRE